MHTLHCRNCNGSLGVLSIAAHKIEELHKISIKQETCKTCETYLQNSLGFGDKQNFCRLTLQSTRAPIYLFKL